MRRDHASEYSRDHGGGITRVELFVIVALGVVLAGCGKAVVEKVKNEVHRGANQDKALVQAKGIAQALRVYAADEDGAYPAGENSNEAFAAFFPEIGTEAPFYVRGSAWHGKRFEDGPDELWDENEEGTPEAGIPLEPGENHWAFNVLADAESPSHLPLIADGSTERTGVYSSDRSKLGGVWGGKTAIVVYCDGSGEIVDLDRDGRFTNPRKNNRDEFDQPGVEMINPAKPID